MSRCPANCQKNGRTYMLTCGHGHLNEHVESSTTTFKTVKKGKVKTQEKVVVEKKCKGGKKCPTCKGTGFMKNKS